MTGFMDITLQNINKSFDGLLVLSNLTLRFEAGKTSCIMGPSGCGKTTLLHLLLGLHSPDSGFIFGLEDKIPSVVFQENRLLEQYDAFTNIQAICGSCTKEQIATEFQKIGLKDYEGKPVLALSGGMKRRVAILRALMAEDSKLILMDEPFKGLDEALKQQVIDYVKEKTAGKTVIFVTHDKEEAEAMGAVLITL